MRKTRTRLRLIFNLPCLYCHKRHSYRHPYFRIVVGFIQCRRRETKHYNIHSKNRRKERISTWTINHKIRHTHAHPFQEGFYKKPWNYFIWIKKSIYVDYLKWIDIILWIRYRLIIYIDIFNQWNWDFSLKLSTLSPWVFPYFQYFL